jgi:alpha-tubulin suppressor-like RCC1 family protein
VARHLVPRAFAPRLVTSVVKRAEGPSVRRRAVVLLVAPLLVLAVGAAGPRAGGDGRTPAVYRWGVVGNGGKIAPLELSRPTRVEGIPGTVVEIATSNSDGYALTSGGAVYGWGVNSDGELGDGRVFPYATRAVRVSFPAGVRIVSLADPMPFDAAMAIDAAGRVFGWGLDADHDLCLPGLLETRPRRLPLRGVTLATGARTHSLFDSNGTVDVCGSGDAGELGDGSSSMAASPTAVVGLPKGVGVRTLTSSWEGSGALLADGSYYDWGYNAAGQLGDGATANEDVPVKVGLPGPVRRVFQGGSGPANGQTVAILQNGSVWAWGDNDRGQLGDGSRTSSDVPVPVHVPEGVAFRVVGSGGFASYAIDSKGRLWAWGDGRNGQLGTGPPRRAETLPVDVGIRLTDVSATAQNVAGLGTRP